MAFEKELNVVVEVVHHLQDNGYTVTGAHDSEERMEKDDLEEALKGNNTLAIAEYTAAAEQGSIMLKDPEGQRFALHMIYGNSPEEVIADISAANDSALEKGVNLVNERLDDLQEEMRAGPSMG